MTIPRFVILAKAGIHKIILPFFVIAFSITASIFAPIILASAQTDYEYQYGQYRLNYPEYKLLKADYLNTPSLDNQQKAMIAAKQSIGAREQTKATFSQYILDLIGKTQTVYPPIQPIIASLAASREFYLMQAQKSQGIITQDDLKTFSLTYQKETQHHDRMIKFGILARKLASLVRTQIDSITALDDLVSKLPETLPVTVTARIQELRDSNKLIDAKIDLISKNLDFVESEESADAEIFFSSRVEKLIDIQAMQLDWITRLIDIDKNYATNR